MSFVVMGATAAETCGKCDLSVQRGGQLTCPYREKNGGECPVKPLPEKHGRLIDADALKNHSDIMVAIATATGDNVTAHIYVHIASVVSDEIIAPTIIEAEGGE